MNYSEFQNLPSSEKITLAILSAAKRLMGWSVHDGSIYKLENFEYSVISTLKDSGTAYTQVDSLEAMAASKFFLDRDTKTLYVQASDSSNPNGKVLIAVLNLHFANVPMTLPNDLGTGFDVYWEPLVRNTSEFGVAIDTIAQSSDVIEGSGTLTMANDFDFWPKNYDKLTFDNQRCLIYSYHRDLSPSDARLIYKGRIDSKTYSKDTVSIKLKDQFAELRSPILLDPVSDLEMRTGDDLAKARQRMVFGRVLGLVPVNLDRVLDGYPLTGTLSVNFNSLDVTGVDTQFLAEVSPGDQLILNEESYTVATVPSDTALTLSSEYLGDVNIEDETVLLDPKEPKRWMNRIFQVAGHPVRQPETTTMPGSTITRLIVEDATDFFADDIIYIGALGTGESVEIQSVINGRFINLKTSLSTIPGVGTTVIKPSIQNVRIDDMLLRYYRDYTFDPETAILTLRQTAEANAAPIYQFNDEITFTNGSRTVTGSGFNNLIKPGYMIGAYGNASFFEVLAVVSDAELSLRTAPNFSLTALGRYKSKIYDEGETVLSLDVLGRTEDGETNGRLLKTAPSITRALIEDAGLASEIDTDSFDAAEEIAYQHVGLAIPDTYNGTSQPTYRDVINQINGSVIGSLIQTVDYKFGYQILRPRKSPTAKRFNESDILSFTVETKAENVVKTVTLDYAPKEYDYLTLADSVRSIDKTSVNAALLAQTERTRTISTLLVNSNEAEIMAARWSFLLSIASGRVKFTTKLQGMSLEVGEIIDVEHRKLFERFGTTGKRKLLLVESVTRSGTSVTVEAVDLSNTFNRVACFNTFSNEWSEASEDERIYGGYYTDDYGLIDNDASNFETNLYW